MDYFWLSVATSLRFVVPLSVLSSPATSGAGGGGDADEDGVRRRQANHRVNWRARILKALRTEKRWEQGRLKSESLVVHTGCSALAYDAQPPLQQGSSTKIGEFDERLFVGLQDGTLMGVNVKTGDVTQNRHLHMAPISYIAVSPAHTLVATAAFDGALFLWDRETLACLKTLLFHKKSVTCCQFGDHPIAAPASPQTPPSPFLHTRGQESGEGDPRPLAATGETSMSPQKDTGNGEIGLTESPSKRQKSEASSYVEQSFLVSGGMDGLVVLWDLVEGKKTKTLKAHDISVLCLKFNQSANLLLTGGTEGSVKAWTLQTFTHLRSFSGHTGPVTCLDADPETDTLVTGSYDGDLRIWRLQDGVCLRVLSGHTKQIYTCQMRDSILLSVSQDGTARLWNGRKGQLVRTMTKHKGSVDCGVFGENMAFTGSVDHRIIFWRLLS